MSLLPELQFEREKKGKKKSLFLDRKSDRKYCPESFAGMYMGILNPSQSNRDIVLINPRSSAAIRWHHSINFNITLSVYNS